MEILKDIKPERPLHYFEEICKIPHGSRNTKAISDYCVNFAKEHGLNYVQDDSNNVVIYKDAYEGYENSETVILQGHLDMVCEKTEDYSIDFEKDPIELMLEGNMLTANGTTLGADDGVAVCFMLAILEDKNIKAPSLECVFTVDEEIGMLGAAALDMSLLKGRRMINLDNEEEGMLLIGCAGGITAECHLPVKCKKNAGRIIEINISGLTGGHSGQEIIKQRANGNVLMGRTLAYLSKEFDFCVVSVNGGLKDNAITRSTKALIAVSDAKADELINEIDKLQEIYISEFKDTDPELILNAKYSADVDYCLDDESTLKLISVLNNLPNGVQKMSQKIPGLVQSSLNMGILKTHDDEVIFSFSIRSDVKSEKQEMCLRLESLLQLAGGSVSYNGDYPAWELKENSYLQTVMKEKYLEQFGYESKMGTIHAGLECGIFSDGLPGLDCVSIGPTMHDIHTPSERLDLKSTERYWEYVLSVLDRLK